MDSDETKKLLSSIKKLLTCITLVLCEWTFFDIIHRLDSKPSTSLLFSILLTGLVYVSFFMPPLDSKEIKNENIK